MMAAVPYAMGPEIPNNSPPAAGPIIEASCQVSVTHPTALAKCALGTTLTINDAEAGE